MCYEYCFGGKSKTQHKTSCYGENRLQPSTISNLPGKRCVPPAADQGMPKVSLWVTTGYYLRLFLVPWCQHRHLARSLSNDGEHASGWDTTRNPLVLGSQMAMTELWAVLGQTWTYYVALVGLFNLSAADLTSIWMVEKYLLLPMNSMHYNITQMLWWLIKVCKLFCKCEGPGQMLLIY